MVGDYKIEDLYQGGYSSLDSNYGELFTGYHGNIEQLGISTDPRTANILKEFTDKLAPGQKVVELSLITPEVLEAVPKQHLKEIQRLSKLTGVEPTVHGTLLDASGVTQQGFSEQQRQIVERKLLQTVGRSHELNPDGNIPVTFHTANQLPGAKWSKISEEERKERSIKETEEIESMFAVNRETGQIAPLKKETRYYPEIEGGGIKKKIHSVDEQLMIMNRTEWDNALQQLIIPKEHADRILSETYPLIMETGIYPGVISKKINPEKDLTVPQQQALSRFMNAHEQLRDIETHLNSLFSRGYKAYDAEKNEKAKNYLKKMAEDFSNKVIIEENGIKYHVDPMTHSNALQGLMSGLRIEALGARDVRLEVPNINVSAEKFAMEESIKTFGNVAWDSYKKFKDKAPIINIENPPAGFGLSRGQDVRDMVEGSRKKFIENAKKEGMSGSEAKKQAEKLIGVTWDVGHINQLRQFGFTGEDIVKEAGKVAHLVKHIHLSDNFGMENTELPMGMGNVDLKEVMEKLKEGGTDVDKTRKIVEAAHWWQFFTPHGGGSPIGPSMEALGSPIYSMKMAPYWNQALGFHQGYFGGSGSFLPQINYETFGAGFSQLPTELGGQRQGGGQGGRMSGRPME